MQTPPPKTGQSKCVYESADEDDIPGTPPSSGSFSLKGLLSPGRGGVPGPPPAPSKLRRNVGSQEPTTLPLKELVILTILWKWIANLGAGSFGTVDKVVFLPAPDSPPGTPCSPPVAMKTVKQSPKQGSKALCSEAANVGSPGCASGVAGTCEKGYLYLFTPLAIPLSSMILIGATLLEDVIKMTKEAIMKAPLSVVFDCKPDNLGFVCKGEATVIADANGQPCAGPVTVSNSVVFLDLGNCQSPDEADKNFNPLLDDEALETEEQQAIFCKFKCKMMKALLRNQFAVVPEDERVIVARICTEYRYCYAGGEQYQDQKAQ